MDHVEIEGDTIEKAIENALKLLGVEREKITVDILSEGKKGILGFGSQKARILATLRKPPSTCGLQSWNPLRWRSSPWWRQKRRPWGRRRKKYW
jgi:spoIIIJ-associated protein